MFVERKWERGENVDLDLIVESAFRYTACRRVLWMRYSFCTFGKGFAKKMIKLKEIDKDLFCESDWFLNFLKFNVSLKALNFLPTFLYFTHEYTIPLTKLW